MIHVGLPRLVGLNGRARSGKDTAAAHLVNEYGYTRIAWADALRDCARALNPIVGWELRANPAVRWAELYDRVGYEAAKDHSLHGAEFRRVLLRLGTEAGRNILGEDTWVNATLNRMDPERRYVIADTRFPNEAEAVTQRGGAVFRIERAGLPQIDHPSETSLDSWEFDGRIKNDGTLDDLYAQLDAELLRLRAEPGRWISTV